MCEHTSNIANQDTPGYRAKAVKFEDAFKVALESGDWVVLASDGVETVSHAAIADVLHAPTDESVLRRVRGDVAELTEAFPIAKAR